MKLKPLKKCKCSECERSYESKDDLEYHMNSVHLNKKPHRCDLCPKSFYNGINLKIHVDIAHLKAKSFKSKQKRRHKKKM